MASRRDVIQETNARYWIGTGHKLGEALDPKDPTDRMHAQRWLDTFKDLVRQNARGTLTLFHKDPSFSRSLDDAINAYRIERSTPADDPRYAEARRAKHQALSDAALWQEMIMSRGSAVSGGWRHYGNQHPVIGAEGTSMSWLGLAIPVAFGVGMFYWLSRSSAEERELEKSVGQLDRQIAAALRNRR